MGLVQRICWFRWCLTSHGTTVDNTKSSRSTSAGWAVQVRALRLTCLRIGRLIYSRWPTCHWNAPCFIWSTHMQKRPARAICYWLCGLSSSTTNVRISIGRNLTATPQVTLQRQLRHDKGVPPTQAPALLPTSLQRQRPSNYTPHFIVTCARQLGLDLTEHSDAIYGGRSAKCCELHIWRGFVEGVSESTDLLAKLLNSIPQSSARQALRLRAFRAGCDGPDCGQPEYQCVTLISISETFDNETKGFGDNVNAREVSLGDSIVTGYPARPVAPVWPLNLRAWSAGCECSASCPSAALLAAAPLHQSLRVIALPARQRSRLTLESRCAPSRAISSTDAMCASPKRSSSDTTT